MYTPLSKSHKNRYPFKIGTTSYIYPDNIIPNVKMLGPYLDEIELLIFESSDETLPSSGIFKELAYLSKEFDITYNIHLPTDISLADPLYIRQKDALNKIKRVVHLAAPVSPSTYTLHLPYDFGFFGKEAHVKWSENIFWVMEELLSSGIESKKISIENLMYPFEWAENLIKKFNLSVCMDMGHLILQNINIEDFFFRYYEHISIIHLHGVDGNKDHISLDCMKEEKSARVVNILKKFKGVVSIEVFSFNDLKSSLETFDKIWDY